MRDICGLGLRDKVTDPACSAAWAANGREKIDILAANAEAVRGVTGRRVRSTVRSRQVVGQALREWEEANPEAAAAQKAAFGERVYGNAENRARWEEANRRAARARPITPGQRADFAARMQTPEVRVKRDAYIEATAQKHCDITGCDKPHLARGYCAKHWRRWSLYGNPLGKPGPRPKMPPARAALAGASMNATHEQIRTEMATKGFVTVAKYAAECGVSARTVRKWIKAERLNAEMCGGVYYLPSTNRSNE